MSNFGMKPQQGKTAEHKPFIIHKQYISIDACETIGPELCTLVKAALSNPSFPLEVDNGQLFLRVDIAFQIEPNTIPPADHYTIEQDGSITVGGKAKSEPKPKIKPKATKPKATPTAKATSKKPRAKKGGK